MLTDKEQKQFEVMVRKKCRVGGNRRMFIKRVADFILELTGDVNWRMAVFNRYEKQ